MFKTLSINKIYQIQLYWEKKLLDFQLPIKIARKLKKAQRSENHVQDEEDFN